MAAGDLRGSIGTVIGGTAACGLAGGLLGGFLGIAAPGFMSWIESPATGSAGVPPAQFGLGLGASVGLLLGALGCTMLACAHAWRGTTTKGRDGDGHEREE